MLFSVIASVLLASLMTIGDWMWAEMYRPYNLAHLVPSLIHRVVQAATICLSIGLAVGIRAGRPRHALPATLVIIVLAAMAYLALASVMGLAAFVAAWMLLWIMFAVLKERLTKAETLSTALRRGLLAAFASGIMFAWVSQIWITDWRSEAAPNLLLHFGAAFVVFLPGFAALFVRKDGMS